MKTPVNDSSTNMDWLTVTDDSDAIEQIKLNLSDLEFQHLTKICGSLSGMFCIDEMTFARIERNREKMLSHLSPFLNAAKISDQGVGAAALLCSVKEKAGRDFACAVLKAGNPDQRGRLLYLLLQDGCDVVQNDWDPYRAFLIEDEEFLRLLQGVLETPDADVHAIRLCSKLQISGINAILLRLLRSGHSSFSGCVSLLNWLSEHEPIEEILQHSLEALDEWKSIEGFSLLQIADEIFCGFLRAGNESVKAKARQSLMDLVSGWLNDGDGQLHGISLGGSLDLLCESCEYRELPWLRNVVQKVNGLHAYAPLIAMMRLDPDAGRQILLDWLRQRNKQEAGLRVARDTYYETSDQELISFIQSMAPNVSDRLLWWGFNTLNQIGGPAAYQTIASHLQRLDPPDERFLRHSEEYETTVLLQAVAESGTMHPEAVRELSKWWEECDASDRPTTSTLRGIFSAAESEVFFDPYEIERQSSAETFPTRVPWETLSDGVSRDIQRFAAASCGTFHPELTLAEFQENPDPNSDLKYLVTFIYKKTLYQAEFMRPRHVGRLKAMINAALKNAGIAERFVEVAAIRPERAFVFAKPEVLKLLANRFRMSFEDNIDESLAPNLPTKHRDAADSEG